MPPSFAVARASLLTRAWLCAVTIRSVSGAISCGTTSLGLACTATSIPAERAAGARRWVKTLDKRHRVKASVPSITRHSHLSPRAAGYQQGAAGRVRGRNRPHQVPSRLPAGVCHLLVGGDLDLAVFLQTGRWIEHDVFAAAQPVAEFDR